MDITRISLKNILFIICTSFLISPAYSQKELWGYRKINEGEDQIIKVTLDGNTADTQVMHDFDPTGVMGRYPAGRLFEASNGKLYGIAISEAGQDIPNGVLFEYDPVSEQYRVLNNTIVNCPNGILFGLIEPVPGVLYGTTNNAASIFKYTIATEEASIVATIPVFPYQLGTRQPTLNSELMKASDGYLYATAGMAPSSSNVPYPGGIYRLNLTSGQLTKVYVFGTEVNNDVLGPVNGTKLVEGAPGKLYGTAGGGQHVGPQGVAPGGSGTIYEYTIATNTVVKKYDFDYATIGCHPTPIIKSGNKLYGALTGLSYNPGNYPNGDGSLFEYDLTTESLTVTHVFDHIQDDQVRTPIGMLLKASDGNIYGGNFYGHYQFDPLTGIVTRKTPGGAAYSSEGLIEICRKPSYPPFETATFTTCENTSFSFDLHNTNATSYVWKKGSTVLTSQTTAVLSFANVTPANTGIYTCTMTNECGTTITMPLQLTVDTCMGVDEVSGLNAVKLYPNPATNILNLQLPDANNFEIQKASIINMIGQTVYTGTGKTTAIDVSSLPTGMYQLLLTTDKGDWNGKFIKQ